MGCVTDRNQPQSTGPYQSAGTPRTCCRSSPCLARGSAPRGIPKTLFRSSWSLATGQPPCGSGLTWNWSEHTLNMTGPVGWRKAGWRAVRSPRVELCARASGSNIRVMRARLPPLQRGLGRGHAELGQEAAVVGLHPLLGQPAVVVVPEDTDHFPLEVLPGGLDRTDG